MMLETLRDLRFALRQLRKHPGFTLAAVLTLALGIGLNSAVFSVVNGLLFRPLPVSAPEELVAVYTSEPGDFMANSPLASTDFEMLSEESRGFGELAAYTYNPLAVEHGGENRLVLGVRATRNIFEVLGIEAASGRTFTQAGDEAAGAEAAEAVLSHTAWRRHFGADPEIVGSTLRVAGRPAVVVGIAPEGFFGLTRGVAPEIWMPLPEPLVSGDRPRDRELRWLWAIGRKAPGAELAAIEGELTAFSGRLAERHPDTHENRRFAAYPAETVRILPGIDTTLSAASAVLLAVVALVLLIASANVAHLLLARALDRRREIATRLALGAEPSAIVRQLMTESLLLAFLGGAAGLGLALASNAALGLLRLPLPVELALGLALDGRVFAYTLGAALLAVVAFGLAPAVTAARTDVAAALGGGAGPGRQGRRLGGVLVIAQVALSCLLLVAAGLMLRSLGNVHAVDPGFDPEGVAVVTFAPQLDELSREERESFHRRLLERVRELPEVSSAGLASHLPLTVEIRFETAVPEGLDLPAERRPAIDTAMAGPGYFESLRIPLLRGRGFDERDEAGSPRVAVVNQHLAERFWPGGEALGEALQIDGEEETYRVVGIVANGKYRTLGEPTRPFLYRALAQHRGRVEGKSGQITTGSETLVARTRGEPRAVLPELRRILGELDPRVAVARLETLEDTLGWALFLPRTGAAVFGLFGLLGLVLTAVGLVGVLGYAVRRRRREMGIRIALGAERFDVLRLVLREGLVLTLVGVAIGLGAALATTRALTAVLYGIGATDPMTFLGVAAFLLAVALVASYLPARRAAAVDPSTALRAE